MDSNIEIAKLNAAALYVEDGNGINSLEDFGKGFEYGYRAAEQSLREEVRRKDALLKEANKILVGFLEGDDDYLYSTELFLAKQ